MQSSFAAELAVPLLFAFGRALRSPRRLPETVHPLPRLRRTYSAFVSLRRRALV